MKAFRLWTFSMKYRIIRSVMSKSAMTPSFMGRTAVMFPGVLPTMSFASFPTARMLLRPMVSRWTATTEGSLITIPRPLTMMMVLAVPRSIAISLEKNPISLSSNIPYTLPS